MFKRTLLTMLCVASCALTVGVASASAAIYVSSSPAVAGGKSCVQPTYNKVQQAITAAAPGATIQICSGTYTEQLTIEKGIKLNAINGAGTATVAMPATGAANATDSCNTAIGPKQKDEISICTSETVKIVGVTVQALTETEDCGGQLYGIFVAGGATLKSTNMTINGASTTVTGLLGCQYGVAVEVGNKTPAAVGHAILNKDTITGYQKNGPTVKSPGSTLLVTASTVTGAGPSPYIAQNGIQISYGAKGNIKATTVSGNECNVGSCGPTGEQASGVLFFQAAEGSNLVSSKVHENDLGVYYASGSAVVPATPDVTVSKDILTSNRYEGVLLEEGKASLLNDTINGSGRVGIDLFQAGYQESSSESSSTGTKISGQSEAAIKVESDKEAGDPPGKFTFANGTATGNGAVLINESNNFEVVF